MFGKKIMGFDLRPHGNATGTGTVVPYFPDTDLNKLDEVSKQKIVDEIEADFKVAYEGILHLPLEAKFGVYTAYVYYKKLLSKLKKTPSAEIKNTRIRVTDYQKLRLFAKCYVTYRLNIL